MTHIAFFGHDAGDAAIRRRVSAFQDDGFALTGFMMRRREDCAPDWENVDLGLTRDGAFIQRLRAVRSGARLAAGTEALARADLIYARNLDMLACAFLAKRQAGLATPVVYESLDVHRLLTRGDPVGRAMRALEGALLERCNGLVVSSPAFLRNHFEPHHGGRYTAHLVENRLAARAGAVPRAPAANGSGGRALRIGWVGNLRCQRSFQLLLGLADRFGHDVEIHLHGQPARREIPVFEPEIDARRNVHFHGRYAAPDDLAGIYGAIDVVWAGDFMEAGFNSVWLLPNRVYEGGYHTTPAIAPAGTETANWIGAKGAGFAVDEPLETSLPGLVGALIKDRTPLRQVEKALADLPADVFVEPPGTMTRVITDLMASEARS